MRISAPCQVSILAAFILASGNRLVQAAQYSGSIRAADQPVPGAMITARQGDTKVIAYSDENGRYSMELAPGSWDISVEMFEFTTAAGKLTVADAPTQREWALEMPKLRERLGQAGGVETTDQATAGAVAAAAAAQQAGAQAGGGRGGRGGRGGGRGGPGGFGRGAQGGFGARGGTGAAGAPGATGATGATGTQAGLAPGRGFQNAQIRATQSPGTSAQPAANADAQPQEQAAIPSALDDNAGDEAFLVNGSTSGGLAQSGIDEATRQRLLAGRGQIGAGGAGGQQVAASLDSSGLASTLGMPAGMVSPTNDTLGLGGFGAAAINGGFGIGAAAGPSGGGFGGAPGGGFGQAAGGRGGGGGGGGGGAGGGRGGGGRGGGRGANTNVRGAFGGQFNTIGNRRRNPYKPTGTLSWNGTNSALNAAPYSLNGQPSQKPDANTNSYSATFGGALVIPKIIKWTRAQYSISYQGTHNLTGVDRLSTVPTAAMLSGDLSTLSHPVTIYDPRSGNPFPGNIIPQSRIDSAAQGLLQYFPQPTYTGLLVQNYRLIASTPNNSQNIGVRFYAPLNNKDRLNFNVQFQSRASYTLQSFGFEDTTTGDGLSASVGWNHSFRPRINNTATVNFSRNYSTTTPYFANKTDVAAELGIMGTTRDPLAYGPPNLSFTNFGSISDGSASVARPQTLGFTDAFTYIIGRKHNLTFGFTWQRQWQNNLTYANTRGSYSFSGLLTSQANAQGNPVSGTGYDFADFLLGLPATSSLRLGSTNTYLRNWNLNGYAQDDFRMSPGVTINVGLRYEYFAPSTELRGHLANLDVNPSMTEVAVVTPGEAGPYSGSLPSSLIRPDKEAFSPRLGLAWRPSQKHNLVTRMGYSIFYSGSAYSQIASQMASQAPFVDSQSFSTGPANPLTIQNGFYGPESTTVTNTFAIDPNYRLAYAQTWNATIQETLKGGMLLEVEYIGTKGTRLGVVLIPNRSLSGSGLSPALPIPYASVFTYQTSNGDSIFHAGETRLTKRLGSGLAATALYTYSKSIDDVSSFSGPGGTAVQFIDNFRLERGLSNTDQRHNLSTTLQYNSPVGVRGRLRNTRWFTTWLRGWGVMGTYNLTSGTPLTAIVAGNLSNTGGGSAAGGTLRAQATGLPIQVEGSQYFNPLAFTTPISGEFGNAGRNTIPGLLRPTVQASLRRTFRLGESSQRTLAFQLNTSNTLNHPTITGVGTTVNANTFSLPTQASQMRTVSMSMRFTF
jgi:trimeric autotransporter adhesin